MTTQALIKLLQKMPPTAKVYLSDHDHAHNETNGPATTVHLLRRDEADEEETSSWASDTQQVVVIGV